MKVYVVVEMFKGGITPEVRGVYKNKETAEVKKNNYRFAYIDEQTLIEFQNEQAQEEVYVVMELLKLNVPRVVGVYKNKELAHNISVGCEYDVCVIEEKLG